MGPLFGKWSRNDERWNMNLLQNWWSLAREFPNHRDLLLIVVMKRFHDFPLNVLEGKRSYQIYVHIPNSDSFASNCAAASNGEVRSSLGWILFRSDHSWMTEQTHLVLFYAHVECANLKTFCSWRAAHRMCSSTFPQIAKFPGWLSKI